jgi:glycosyltransferase involved in cell wall biosynthesis
MTSPLKQPALRVVQATLQYTPMLGGVTTAARETSQRLRDRGHDVRVITADPSWTLPPREDVAGIEVRRSRAWPKGGDQLVAPGVYRDVRSSAADVVHVQCYHTAVAPLAMAAAARAHVPYVLTFHGGGHSLSHRNRLRDRQLQTLRPLLARAAALIATAAWEIDRYSDLLGLKRSKFVLIPNGADLAAPERDVAAPNNGQSTGTLLVSLGRLEHYKGHHRAIKALPHVLKEVPDARLWLAGAGPYEDELLALARQLGIANRVEARAETDRAVYSRRIAGAAAGLLISDFETHPIAAIEALGLGVPMLVGLDGGGLSELAQRRLATGVELDASPETHAAAIVELVRNPPPPVQVEATTWDDCVDELESLYQSIVRSSVGPVGARP